MNSLTQPRAPIPNRVSSRAGARVRRIVAVVVMALAVASCQGDQADSPDPDPVVANPHGSIDLTGDLGHEDDPNAESRQLIRQLARRQCLDDPDLDEGLIRMVNPETGATVNEFTLDCDEVRAQSD